MAASGIRMGGVFVEIGADAAKFFATLNGVNKEIGKVGKSMVSIGTRMAGVGVGLAAPIAAAVKQGAQFESVLLDVKASTGATTAELESIRNAAMGMSQALGVGPTQAAQGMLNLLKAGVPLEQVLAGAGQAALQFAKVANMDGAMAAEVMSKAMNAFGVDAATAANAMSAGADASATSVLEMAQAFSQASAVASTSNQSITDLSAALAVLANKGIVGSDAGTSIKTMLQKLKVPTDASISALEQIGLTFDSFRGADGKLLPLVSIISVLNNAIAGVDEQTKDNVFGKLFGSDAIRAASILSSVGVEGFTRMKDGMAGAMSVGDKFNTLMSGLSGAGLRIAASMERLAIAVSDAVAPAVSQAAVYLSGFVSGLATMAAKNKELVMLFAKFAGGLILAGGALAGIGIAIQGVSYGFAGLGKALYLIVAPLAAIITTVISVGASFVGALVSVGAYATGAIAAATATAAAWGLANVPLIAMAGAFLAIGGLAAGVVASLVSGAADVAAAVGDSMQPSIERAGEAFVEIKRIGIDAFGAIKDAIAGGDLQGAMEIAIAGLQAAFSVGSKAFMDSVDEWGTNLVNAFDFYISNIPFLRFAGPDKFTFAVFGDSSNATTPDQRADNRFSEMDQRKAERKQQAADAVAEFDRVMRSRPAASAAAMSGMTSPGKLPMQDVPLPTPSGGTGSTMGGEIGAVIGDLQSHLQMLSPPAAPDVRSQVSAAGTFSSLNLNASLGASTVTERIAKAAEETAKNTRNLQGDTVAA